MSRDGHTMICRRICRGTSFSSAKPNSSINIWQRLWPWVIVIITVHLRKPWENYLPFTLKARRGRGGEGLTSPSISELCSMTTYIPVCAVLVNKLLPTLVRADMIKSHEIGEHTAISVTYC